MKYITLSWKVLHLMNISGTTSASFQAHCVDNSNTAAWAYTCRGLLTKIQVNQCWLWSVWLFWLLDLFLEVIQILKYLRISRIELWQLSESPRTLLSDIIILGESLFSFFFKYLLSSTLLLYNMITWFVHHFNNSTLPLHKVYNDLTCIHII